jgi:acyl-CoA thioesterase FadM
VARLGTTGMTTRFDLRRDGEILVETEMRHVFVEHGTHSKTPIPDWIREGLAFATEEPEQAA